MMKMLVSISGKMKVAATRNALPLLEEMPGGGRQRVPATAVEENVSKSTTAGCCLERASSPTAEVAGVSCAARLLLLAEVEPQKRDLLSFGHIMAIAV
jgi:hypothetical protein